MAIGISPTTTNESRDMTTSGMDRVLWIKQAQTGDPEPTGPENQRMRDQLDSKLSHLGCRIIGHKSRGGLIALMLPEAATTKLVEEEVEQLGYVIHGEEELC